MNKLIFGLMAACACVGLYSCDDNDDPEPVVPPAEGYEIRTLTFEDADAKFAPYTLDYCSKSIAKWSDLIDATQYGGVMLYGTSGQGMDAPYFWYDKGNTELRHEMPMGYGNYCYWSGGHAVSNYFGADYTGKDFNSQLEVAIPVPRQVMPATMDRPTSACTTGMQMPTTSRSVWANSPASPSAMTAST